MIQRPTSGALDLELSDSRRSGEESFAITATDISKHLQSLKFFC
jgi:hypothetical protein